MTISNAEFAADLDTALQIEDGTARLAALVSCIDQWNGGSLSNAKFAVMISALVASKAAQDTEISNLALGARTDVVTDPAGQPAPGYFPITLPGGGVVWKPSLDKLQAEMLKGDPAKVGVVFEVFGKPAPNVVMAGYPAPGNQVFTNAGSIGYARVAAAAAASFAVKKNGVTAGVITFALGATVPVFALTGGQVSAVRGDILEVTTPTSQDATLSSPTFVFAGD